MACSECAIRHVLQHPLHACAKICGFLWSFVQVTEQGVQANALLTISADQKSWLHMQMASAQVVVAAAFLSHLCLLAAKTAPCHCWLSAEQTVEGEFSG